MFPTRLAAALVVVALVAAACSGGTGTDADGEPEDTPATPGADPPVDVTFEEAGKIAVGELFRIYGTEAQPAPFEVRGEPDELDGRAVWRLDGIYEVGEERRLEEWTFWIATPGDGEDPAVLRSDGPRPADSGDANR